MRCGLRGGVAAALGFVSFLAVGLGLSACSAVGTTANPEVPNWETRPNYAMSLLYRRSLVAGSRIDSERHERGRVAIDEENQRLFVGSSDRGMYAVRASDGLILWRFETMGAVQSEPLYDAKEDSLFFGSNDGAMYKVNATTGKLLWRYSTNAEVARKPVLRKGVLYFMNANDTLIAIDASSGDSRFNQHRSPALGMEIAGHAGLLVSDDRIFVAFSDGTVTSYDATTGRERWQPVDLAAEAEQSLGDVPKYLDVDTTPIEANVGGVQAIIVGSYEGGVFALDMNSGDQLWSNPSVLSVTDVTLWEQPAHTDEAGTMYPERRMLIASTGTTGMWALNPDNGEEIWHRSLPDGGTNRPAFILGAMLVTTSKRGAFLVYPLNGSVIDGVHTSVGFSMAPSTAGQRAFVLSNNGELLAFSVPRP